MTTYLTQRVDVYKKLAAINPQDATTQLSLATAAIDASDTTTAIAAYKAFLKLAPNDSQAPTARKTLKQLESQQTAQRPGRRRRPEDRRRRKARATRVP